MADNDDIVQKVKIEAEGGDKVAEQYNKAAEAAEKAAEKIQKAGESGGAGFEKTGEAAEKASEGLKQVGDEAKETGQKLSEIGGDAFKELSESITELGRTSKETFGAATEAAKKFGNVGEDLQKLAAAITTFSERSTTGSQSFQQLASKLAETKATLIAASDAATKATEGFAKIGEATEKAASQTKEIGEKLVDTTKGLTDIEPVTTKVAEGFTKTGEASTKAAEGIGKIGDAASKAHPELSKVADASEKAATSASSLTLENAKLVAQISKYAVEITETGVEIYQLTQKHEGWIKTLIKLGFEANTATKAISLLAEVLGPAAVSMTAIGVAAAAAVTGLVALEQIATKAAKASEDLNHSFQMLAQSSGQTSEQLQRGKAAYEQIGLSADKFRTAIGKIAEAIKGTDVGAELQKSADASKDAARKVLEAERELLEFQTGGRIKMVLGDEAAYNSGMRLQQVYKELNSETDKAKQLADKLADAQKKQAEVAANSMSKVLEQIKAIAEGQKGIKFDELTSGESKIKALTLAMKETAESGKIAGRTLVDYIANVKSLQDAVSAGAKFGLNEEDVDKIRRASGHLGTFDEIWKRIQNNGVLIPPESAAAFERMRTEIQAVDSAWARLEQAWESTVLAKLGAQISSVLNSLKAGLINFASEILEAFNTVSNGIVSALKAAFEFGLNGWKMLVNEIAKTELGKQFGLGFTEGIDVMNKGLAVAAGSVAKFFGASDEAVKKLRTSIMGYDESQRKAGDTAAEMWRKTAEGANNASEAVKKSGDASGEAGKKTADGAKTAKQSYDDLATKVQDVARQTGKSTQQVLDDIKNMKPQLSTADMMKQIEDAAKSTVEKIKQLFKIELEPVKPINFDAVTNTAKEAAQKIAKAFEDIKIGEFIKPDWDKMKSEATDAADDIKKAFADINLDKSDFSKALNFEEIVEKAERAAKDIENAFGDVKLTDFTSQLDFSGIVQKATEAVQQIKAAFDGMNIGATVITIDFTPVITAGTNAAQQISQAFMSLATTDFTALATAAQTAFDQISQAATTTATAISTAFAAVDFSGLISQINQVTEAFRAMEAAANAAASAAAAAASAGGGASGGSRMGGLFRGKPGTDTNLTWLTDYEFVMRPEAVMKYGVRFMDMINSLSFPMQKGFRAGGLVMPQISIPAFAGGGVNRTPATAGPSRGATANQRTLNLTIGGQTFKGLTAPEETAKQLERAAIGRQTSATGIRPRWNK